MVVTNLDLALHKAAYDFTLARGRPPLVTELATLCSASNADVREALGRLAVSHVFVLQQDSGELLVVPPFSVPTPFLVQTARHASYCSSGTKSISSGGAGSGACDAA